MASSKKCANCGNWTEWNRNPEDICTHCGATLEPKIVKEKEKYSNAQKKINETDFFRIRPEDNFFMKLGRKGAWIIHLIFVSIMSFIIWLSVVLGG